MENEIYDTLLHQKSITADQTILEKDLFPITRWDDILGAPDILDEETIMTRHPSKYAFFKESTITLTDEEYEAIFGGF